MLSVGNGLLTMLKRTTSLTELIAFEVIAGIGFGAVLNVVVVLIQADYLTEAHLVPHVTNLLNFWGFVGRIIAMSTGTDIFQNKLRLELGALYGLPEAAAIAVEAAPNAMWTVVPDPIRNQVLDIYSSSLDKGWWLCLAFSIMCLVSAAGMRNLNIKELGEAAGRVRGEASSEAYVFDGVVGDGERRIEQDHIKA